jgi:hypothetical protein
MKMKMFIILDKARPHTENIIILDSFVDAIV